MTTDAAFILIGDSHCAPTGNAARARDLSFRGGPIGAGRHLNAVFCERDAAGHVIFRDGIAEDLPAHALDDMFTCGLPILSTIGCNINHLSKPLAHHLRALRIPPDHISRAVLRQMLLDAKPGVFAFYQAAAEAHAPIFACYSPQHFPQDQLAAAQHIEALQAEMLTEIGIPLIDVRADTTDRNGNILPRYARDDGVHGNHLWGGRVLDAFLSSTITNP